MSADEMAQAHASDYAAERAFRDAHRAIAQALEHGTHLSDESYGKLVDAQVVLQRQADHNVAVWD